MWSCQGHLWPAEERQRRNWRRLQLIGAEEKCLDTQPLTTVSHQSNLSSRNVIARWWLGTCNVFSLLLFLHIRFSALGFQPLVLLRLIHRGTYMGSGRGVRYRGIDLPLHTVESLLCASVRNWGNSYFRFSWGKSTPFSHTAWHPFCFLAVQNPTSSANKHERLPHRCKHSWRWMHTTAWKLHRVQKQTSRTLKKAVLCYRAKCCYSLCTDSRWGPKSYLPCLRG